MANQTQSEQLDKVIERLLGPPDAPLSPSDAARPFDVTFAPVTQIIRDLKNLPRPDFKARLKSDLERRAAMATATQTVPEFRATVTPYLSVRDAAAAIEFYKTAFGAIEAAGTRFVQPDGRIGHAEINIGGARIMLADEFPEIGFPSPNTLGGSPVLVHLNVPDVDSVGRQAVAAGATVVRPVADQFYGDRSGHFRDPFGYVWVISTRKEALGVEEMQERFRASTQRAESTKAKPEAVNYLREGFHTITPYLIISGAAQWIDFVKQAFGAEERFRAKRPGAEFIMHAEVKIGDSMVELADANPEYPAMPCTLLLRVDDPDAVFARALQAGATVMQPITDAPYGSRGGTVLDVAGNRLHISTPVGPGLEIFKDFRSVTPHLYAQRPVDLINFLKQAFGGKEVYRAEHPDGSIPHAQVRIGDSIVALAGGHGAYTPIPSTLHLYVADADATYEQALRAGATSIQPPADQPYGERSAGVTDPFGNRWFIATHIRDVQM